jgi:hypothetical protein
MGTLYRMGWLPDAAEEGRRQRPVVALNSLISMVSRLETTPRGGERRGWHRETKRSRCGGWSEAVGGTWHGGGGGR